MRILPFFALVMALPVPAQVLLSPTSASTRLYFPQFADGGSAAQKWTTTLVLVNPANTTASVSVSFYSDIGQPLALDFGQGATATLLINIAAGGSVSYTSTAASSTIVVGWALATSNVPVLGTILYQASQNGTPIWDVSATGTGSTYYYSSFANPNLGIALVNPSTTQTINLQIAIKNQNGTSSGTKAVTLAPNAHTSFTLGSQLASLPASFFGSLTITSSDTPASPFVAWTLNSRNGLLSSLPQGEFQAPPPYDRRVFDALARIKATVAPIVQEVEQSGAGINTTHITEVAQFVAQLGMSVDAGTTIKAVYQPSDQKIHLSQMAVETLGSDDSALAFLIMHTAILGFVSATGVNPTLGLGLSGGSAENSALLWDTFGLLKADYDPGGSSDCLGRLYFSYSAGVPLDSALIAAFEIPDGTGAIAAATATFMQGGCGSLGAYGLSQDCTSGHYLWHPDYPSQIP